MKTLRISFCLWLTLACGAAVVHAQPIIRHDASSQSLTSRWEWARAQGNSGDFWVGYQITRFMDSNSYIGHFSNHWRDRASLQEVIYGTPPSRKNESITATAKRVLAELNGQPVQLVRKDVALLFRFRNGNPSEVRVTNMELPVDLSSRSLYWLGRAQDPESVILAGSLFKKATDADYKEDLVTAVGVHADADETVPFLKDVLQSDEPGEVRENAAFWLGQTDVEPALSILVHAARSDASDDVREKAVFALSQMEREAPRMRSSIWPVVPREKTCVKRPSSGSVRKPRSVR